MDLVKFVAELSAQGVELWVDGERLRYRSGSALTQTLLDDLKQHKTEILQLLRDRAMVTKTHPLSHGQQALWFLYRSTPQSAAYNIASSLRILSPMDAPVLRQILQTLINRHSSLRTTFRAQDNNDGPVQEIHGYQAVDFREMDASGWSSDELMEQVISAYKRPFDLQQGPLLRANLFTRSERDHVFLVTIHHIVFDVWSMWIFWDEFAQLLSAQGRKEPISLPVLDLRYSDYIHWQDHMLKGEEGARLWAYWQKQLADKLPILDLPTDRPRLPVQTYNGASHVFTLTDELSERLRRLAKAEGSTPFMVFLATFQVLLYRYTGQEDILVGSPTAGRSRPEFSGIVGYFVNMMILRADLSGNSTFRAFLKQVRQTVWDALEHQDYPFPLLVERLQPKRDASRSPIFQVSFGLQKAQKHGWVDEWVSGNEDVRIQSGEFEVIPFEMPQQEGQFDLDLELTDRAKNFTGIFKYNTDLFDEATIVGMSEHFRILLEGILHNPEQPLSRLPLLTEADQRQLLAWNRTETKYPKDRTIVDLFDSQVGKTPDNIAVIFEEKQLSYRELNTRANRLAHYLIALGVEAETLVGICVERSLEMVIGLMGILKAGGVYLPLDPDYPVERLQFMLEDAKVPVLLTQSSLLEGLPASDARTVCLDSDWKAIADYSGENPARRSEPENLAYVIYTSGSTGVPKGAMNTHEGICNRLLWMQDAYGLTAADNILQKTPFSFDVSVWEFFWPLLVGSRLTVAKPGGHQDAGYLIKLIEQQGITTLHFVPSMLQAFVQDPTLKSGIPLRRVICSGEALPVELEKRFFAALPSVALHNLYGPTEAAVDVTYWTCRQDNPSNSVPIGRPIANIRIYILDTHHNPTPPGIPGELCIAGIGLARGYLNRPELTAEKFTEIEVFGKKERLYKTGDLARWLPAGNIEYLGRMDHQIKLRGFRIELGEIEATLSRHEAVREAVVILYQSDDNPRLVAYVTLAIPMDDASGLRSWLKDRLPEYMVPASFTVLDELPLTPNGKIDRKALPVPELAGFTEAHEAPRNETERLLCNLWSEVLGVEIASIRRDFFEAGGHSLLATQLVSRIREGFGVEMPLQVVFGRPLVREQAEWLENAQRGSELPAIMPLAESESMVLSFAQQRLWFLAQLEGQSATYNMPAALRLTGWLDEAALGRAVRALIQRHDSLRMCFPAIKGEATVQLGDICDPLRIVDLDGLSESKQKRRIIQEIFKPFDLSSGPLFRVYLFGLREQEWILLFNMHHIIGDGWSMGVLIRDFSELYNAYAQDREPRLPELPIRYVDYAAWQRDWLSGEILQGQSTYWRDKLAGIPELLELPTDYPRPAVMSYRGAHLRSILDGELAQGVRQLSRQHGVTVFMTLLAAFDVLLSRYSGQTDIVVGSPIANRTHHQTEGLIGFFVNTLALRAALTGEMRFPELLKQVRQTALDAYAHQDIPFEHLVEEINPVRSLSHSPLFQAMFVLQNAPEGALELSGLAVSSLEPESTIAKFDLTLSIADQDGELVCDWVYCTDLFRTETITRMAEHFQVLLAGILEDPEQPLSRLPLLTEAERQQLLAWNRTETDYPKDKTIVDLFQEQVEKTPDNIAVVFEDRELTYGELNGRANRLAHYLMALGVGAETLVGICVERSLEMVIGLMGILKAGGAYVPLDPDYPAGRLQFMLEDARVPVLLTQSSLLEGLPASDARTVCLDSDWEAIVGYSGENPARRSGPENSVYVIYTSGSTGMPKGVVIEQKSVLNYLHGILKYFNKIGNFALVSTIAADLGNTVIFSSLCSGGSLHILSREKVGQPDAFMDYLMRYSIDYLKITPSHLAALQTTRSESFLSSCELLILGGEASHIEWIKTIQIRNPQCRILNHYGPTEATVGVLTYKVDHNQPLLSTGNTTLPIGSPIANTKVHILDAHHNPTPLGVPGELCIAGAGLARGYLNRPELTAEKFIKVEVFGKTERLYKTGDLARWLPDGNLEYLGRIDHQVKLRGFRIELGEIEAALARHEAVREAVVVLLYQGDGNPRLVAYITLTMPMDDASSVLRPWLKTRLPEYMIPVSFAVLDTLPLTPNGKIDRKALPTPDLTGFTEAHEAPRNETEHLLCNLWSKVLGVEITSIRSDFFEAGGHSLLATQLVSRIREGFGVEMPLQVVFGQPLLREQAEWLDNAERGSELPPIMSLAEGEPRVLSFAQQRLWFLAQLEGQSATYNMPAALRLTGRLDEAAMKRAIRTLIQRHDSLRMCFPAVEGEATIQLTDVYDPLTITDLRGLSVAEQQHQETKEIAKHARMAFDIDTGPLLRLCLLLLDEQARVLLFNMHHIISDGWSRGMLIRDFSQLYNAYVQEREPRLPELPIRYIDYAAWQRDWLSGEILQGQSTYWRDKLAGIPELLELPTDYPRPAVMSYRGAHLRSILDGELAQGVRQLSRQHGVTVFMTLLAAFDVLLSRYSGQTDIVVGSPIANRTHHQTEGLIGFFVNTLALRAALTGEMRFPELLKQVRQTALDAYGHQDIPFEYLVEEINPVRSLSHSPLFQVMFVLQNAPEAALELGGLEVSFLEPESMVAKFDLTLSITERDRVLVCEWEYCTDLFRAETVARMAEHFQVLLEGIIDDPAQPLSRLPLLTKAERQQLLTWNRTETDYPKDKTIVDLFERQVEETPDNIAVVFEEKQLSYRELNTRANRLAHYLMALGVGAETLVGICVERSLEMVIGLMGILKAGGTYVPLDPDYPAERLQFMLEDARVPVLLTQSALLEDPPASDAQTVCLDSDWEAIAGYSGENPARRSGPENLAYVIYTSGSTGIPKGVMITHNGFINLTLFQKGLFDVTIDSRVMQFASLSFDAACSELAMTIPHGAEFHLSTADKLLPSGTLITLLKERRISHITLPPSALNALPKETLPDLRFLVVAGEACSAELVEKWSSGRKFINAYGPTESTVCATVYECLAECQPDGNSPPIGNPIANIRIYILDTHHNPTPLGIPGELCIAGAGLARGYLNRPELTAEKFIKVEVFGKPERLYKTGDLACWLPDGNIEYLGRMDHQIKLRGFRIELGEIEATLSRHEAVREAVVVLYQGDDNPRLAAYVTLVMPMDDTSGLRLWLKDCLPEYMVPASFTVLDEFPLTPNGKIDRKALPTPDLTGFAEAHEAPRNETERLLCNLWSEVLGVEIASIRRDFFEAGGHSLLATQLVSRIREGFGVEMPLQVVFGRPLVREQAEWLENAQRGSELPAIMPLAESESMVLSFAQQRLWFLAQLEGQSATYNMPAALRLTGRLDEAALGRAVRALIQRHDSLRMCFPAIEGEAMIRLTDGYNPLTITDLRGLSGDEQQQRVTKEITGHAQAPFDLATGPLLRLRLLLLDEQARVLLFNMHHIIGDGWSMGVLIRDFSELYNAYAQDREPRLPELPIRYVDYAAWQRDWLSGEILQGQSTYWRDKLAGIPELLELPTDYPRPAVMSYRGAHLRSILDGELAQGVRQLSRQHGVTVFMTLLAAFDVLLSRYSGQTDIVVGSPIANRTHHQTEGLIGFFVNTLALRAALTGEMRFPELLKQVRQTALDAYAHQDIPFEHLVEEINPVRSLSHSPLFQAMFVLQNAPEGALELSGLAVSSLEPESTIAKFDLTLSIADQDGELVCDWVYCTDLFRTETITRMAEHFQVLLAGILEDPEQPLSRLPLLTEAERQQLLAWNRTETDYPKDKTIVDLFQEQVEKTPDNIAVVFEDRELTYGELNGRANRLAHYLMALGVGAETLVGICVERSLEMVIGLMGILKAGGAYVPLDPDYPAERLQFMLEDARVPVLLTQSALLEDPPASDAQTVCLDSDWEAIAGYSGENPARRSGPKNLAYVIYTSGSTGVPKGVMNTHAGICNLLSWMQDAYGLTAADSILQKNPFSFDVSVSEFFLPLLVGARLTVAKPGGHQDPGYLVKLIEQQGITTLHFVPSMLQAFVQDPTLKTGIPLRRVICGGEALPVELEKRFFAALPSVALHNLYGPTEAAVDVTYWTCQQDNPSNSVPIGRPIANIRIYILDTHHNPTPPGVPGELCIAGIGLARGYLNRPELTAEKFIEVEVFGKPERLYKTGDLARWLPDGNIEYLGRMDHQIKLRGFRIELGEIEATLSRHEAVKEAVVILYRGDDNPRLAAYVTPAMSMDDTSGLRLWLKDRLPEYMVPASFTMLDEIPLTPNGKIDRKALSRLSSDERSLSGKGFVAPRDTVELQLARIWEEILNARPIGIRDNFFELGGHSLLAIRLIAHMEQALGKKLPLAALFQSATIEGLAVSIRQQMELPWSPLIPIQPKGSRPPLFFAPPWTGHGIAYLELARYFGKEQPFYGLQASGLEKGQKPHTKIEDVAALFLDALQTIQPEGPYHLAGWSFGGWVAIEMARQLRDQDQEVSFLGLLDSVLPSKLPKEYPEQDEVDILMGIFGHNIPLSLEDIRQMEPDGQLTYVIEHCQRLDLLPPEFGREDAQRLLRVSSAHGQAERNYQPQPYQGKIIFFQAAEKLPGMDSDSSSGWDEFATRGLDIHQVPGNHENMVFDPHARVLAEKLKRCLEMAES